MNIHQKGFAPILIILLVLLIGAVGYFVFIGSTEPIDSTESPAPAEAISQLTKEQVLNGYDQCGIQFKNGSFSLEWSEYERLDEEKWKTAGPTYDPWREGCDAHADFSSESVTFADLDGDGIQEALVSARIVRASSGGVLYVFKNMNGTARVVDRIVFGKQNGRVVSVEKDTIVVETDGAMAGGIPTKETHTFVNGRFIKQEN